MCSLIQGTIGLILIGIVFIASYIVINSICKVIFVRGTLRCDKTESETNRNCAIEDIKDSSSNVKSQDYHKMIQ